MNRYGIEDIGNAVKESTICPFMLERECSTLAENDCVRCVKGWFADHDKQIRADVIDDIMELADCDNADCFECAFGSAEMCKLKKLKEQNNESM